MFIEPEVQCTMNHDYATEPVPAIERRPLNEIALNLAGGPICVAALMAGASLSRGLNLVDCVTAIIVSGAIVTAFGATIGSIGCRTGLSTGMLLRITFGKQGCKFVNLILAAALVGWFAVQTDMFGSTLHALFPSIGSMTSSRVASIWGGILMAVTAYFGYKGLSVLSLIAVPLLLVLCSWGLVMAVSGHWGEIAAYTPPGSGSVNAAITMLVGALAVGATTTADTTRYAKSATHTSIACGLAYLLTNGFMLLGGVLMAVTSGSGDLLVTMVALGLGVPALLILLLGQWTTNDDNLYSASLGVTGSFPLLSKPRVVLVLGMIGTTVAAVGAANWFVPFLVLLGVGIPPVGGVIIAHALLNLHDGDERTVSWHALLSWGAGSAVGGLLPYGIPAVNAIAVAIGGYLLLQWVIRTMGGKSTLTTSTSK